MLTASVKAVAGVALSIAVVVSAQTTASTKAEPIRGVKGQTIFSQELPKAELTIAKGFRFAGTQRVNLYGNAEAEQYLFVEVGPNKTVSRFYWVQFEHFLPTNNRTYDYDPKHTTEMGHLVFAYDVKSWPDYEAMQAEDPKSDGAAIERLLAIRHLSFPHKAVRVRLFHLPSADRRAELMIIYGEALAQNAAVPVRQGGVELDKESPGSAQTFLQHARQGLVVQTR